MNAVNAETTRQFDALGPAHLTRGAAVYLRKGGLFDDATNTVRFDFVKRRKQRGAFLNDKITVAVTYQAGPDLYAVKVTSFDGLTLDSADLVDVDGVGFEWFADVALWVGRA